MENVHPNVSGPADAGGSRGMHNRPADVLERPDAASGRPRGAHPPTHNDPARGEEAGVAHAPPDPNPAPVRAFTLLLVALGIVSVASIARLLLQ